MITQKELLGNIWNDKGMTLRQYAAIKLKVPSSGDEELDAMIRASLHNDFAAKAMQGLCANSDLGGWSPSIIAREAYDVADAMMKARENRRNDGSEGDYT